MFSFFGFPARTNVSHRNESPITEDHKTQGRTTGEDCSEAPPMFPAQNSIQRATTSTSTNNRPILRIDSPEDNDELDDDQEVDYDHSDIHQLDIDNLSLPHSTLKKPVKPRKKVQLMPGFSQLDWAQLKSSGTNLRGEDVTSIQRITRSELAQHRSKQDAWSSFNGKVYNITPYLNYHPGGIQELMRVAGKDGTELFMKTHAWISVDGMLDSCLVGFLVND